MSQRRTILTILVVVIVIATTGITYALTHRPSTTNTTKPPSKSAAYDFPGVTITNATSYPNVSYSAMRALAENIYQLLGNKGSFAATIRPNTYHETLNSYGKEIVFIIDIPTAKASYEIDNGVGSGQDSVTITCPSASDVIYKDTVCKDKTSGN